MAKRTIFISEDYPVSQVIACCPPAILILERHLGRDFFKRDDLDRISLKAAVTLGNKQMHPLLIELNRICI